MTIDLNYSSFDFDTIKADLIAFLENDPIFKDYNFAGSNINTIIEIVAGVGDLFNFYINAMADESFIQSAELYENVNKLVELIGYNPSGYKASTVLANLTATIDITQDDDYFTIPKWTEFGVSSVSPEGETIKYTNPSALTYIGTSGSNSFDDDIYLIQGTLDNETFLGTGEAFQKIDISEATAIEEYIEVEIDSGSGFEVWTYVANMYRSVDNTSKVFTTRYNKNQLVVISFGDGTFGVIPPLNADISVNFVKTLGEDGRIGVSEITGIDSDIKVRDGGTGVEIGDAISFTLTQSDASDGGRVPLTVEEVREYGPRAFRTQDRAVTTQDHDDLLVAEFNEFVQESITLNSDSFFELTGESPATSGNYYNNLYLYVLPNTGRVITGNLRTEILDFLEDYKMTTLNYVINNIDFRDIDVDVSFKRTTDTIRTVTEVSSDIESNIRSFFSRGSRDIGEELKYSELMSQLHAISGISSLTMSMSSDLEAGLKYENIQMGAIQFPELNLLTLTSLGTGE